MSGAFVLLVGIKTADDYYRYTKKNIDIPRPSFISKDINGDITTNVRIIPIIAHCISSAFNVTFLGGTGVIFHLVVRYIL